MKSFFAGGGNVPWWISGLSLFMSFFSAGTFVVWGSIAYDQGMVAVTIQLTMAISGLLIFLFIAKRWKKTGALTVAEYITNRFGEQTQKIYTYLFVLISFFTAGAFLYPVAKIVNVSTGYPIEWIVVGLGFTILLYTTVGGFWAVLATDVLQFIILTAAVAIVIPLSFQETGGVQAFLDKTPSTFFELVNEEYSPWFLFAFMVYNFFFIGGNWAYVQRYTSVKNEKEAGKVGLLFGGLYLFFPLIWMLPPMIYRTINPGLSGAAETEGAYLMMCQQALPAGMLGLMIAGMVFATASSVNTTLNMMAAVTTNDLYRAFRKKASERQLMKVARLSTFLFGVGTVIIALMVPHLGGIVNVVLTVAAITGVPLYAPPIWALFSKRQTAGSVLGVTLISLTVNAFFKFLAPSWLGISLGRADEQALGALVPLSLLLLFELYANYGKKEATDYFSNVAKQSEVDKLALSPQESEQADKDKIFGIKVISIAALITGSIIFSIGLFAEKGNAYVLVTGVMLVTLCSYVLLHIKKKNKSIKTEREPVQV
ncbi:sodium:solute symporter family protein [Echinicola sediminis]